MKTLVKLSAIVVALGAMPLSAEAHRDVRLSICIPYYAGAECARRGEAPSYMYGQRVPVRGRVRPLHGGTVTIKRRKGQQPWRVVGRVPLTDGRYRYVWRTSRADADQNTPYKFRAVLPNHDRSRVQKVYVLFGE